MTDVANAIGFVWLSAHYEFQTAIPLRVTSKIAGTKRLDARSNLLEQDFTPAYRPPATFAGHFEFALKYEEINLEFLSRLFHRTGPDPILAWIKSEPTGLYARRTAFLYEWLTDNPLDHPGVTSGSYVDAIDAEHYFTRTESEKNKRWRVNDNLPGTRAFCPLIRLSDGVKQAAAFDIQQAILELEETFGADLLLRSASWLTLKESKASFLIEREADKGDRIKRFAHAIGQYCGKISEPLSEASLLVLQNEILGDAALRKGIRKSPIFVGQDTMTGTTVDYVAPPWERIAEMMSGLIAFEKNTRGLSPEIRAAAVAFAFVYIHPMTDGNGRIHRFLINDILSRDGAVPNGIILPISATISESSKNRADYDRVLDTFSKPFMRMYERECKFEQTKIGADGVPYNMNFTAAADAMHTWRYPDLTQHVEYMGKIIQATILDEMREEARLLRKFDSAKINIKEVVEMPNADADRIIKSISGNNMRVSGKLSKEYPMLFEGETRAGLSNKLVDAVRAAFTDQDEPTYENTPRERAGQ